MDAVLRTARNYLRASAHDWCIRINEACTAVDSDSNGPEPGCGMEADVLRVLVQAAEQFAADAWQAHTANVAATAAMTTGATEALRRAVLEAGGVSSRCAGAVDSDERVMWCP